MYNTYFYIFKIEEVCKEYLFVNQNKKQLIYDTNISKVSFLEKYNAEKSSNKKLNKEINKNDNKNIEIKNNNLKLNKVKCFYLIAPLALFLLGILIINYIIILKFQRNVISSGKNGFLLFYYNNYQRDQLFSLYSVLLSSYFHYLEMTDFSDVMNEDDYIDLIKRYSIEFQNSFHKFYEEYVTNKADGKINYIYDELTVYKISNYFNQSCINDNYIKQSEYIGYITRLISFEDKIENITDDSRFLFLENIFYNENGSKTPTKTYYSQDLYYLSRNYESFYNRIYSSLETEAVSDFNEQSNSAKIIYFCLEMFGFIIIILFYIINLIYLFQTNKVIFRNIINMFISNENKDNYSSKNKNENYFLIKIVSSFIVLMKDFNLDNLHKFQYILNHSSKENISMNITFEIKDDISASSFNISEDNKKINIINNTINRNNYKNEILNIIDNKNNSSEFLKLHLSSSKAPLANNNASKDTLQNLNNPQNILENNNSSNATKSLKSFSNNKTNINLIKNKDKDNHKDKQKGLNNKKEQKKIENNINIEEKVSTNIFLKKLVNNGLKEINNSILILNALFFFALIYGIVKIILSINCLKQIIEIFEDFGVLSYRYSSIYYYFNSLRTLLVFPDFGNETIFETMKDNMADRLKKMNYVFDFKLEKYPSVNDFYWIVGANMDKPRPSPSYINVICYDDQLCKKIINDTKYEILSEGIKMGVTSMYQQIINIYEDYKIYKEDIKKIKLSSFIKEKFINAQYEQIDINLNYIIINIEYRVYELFLTDLTNLINKYSSIIEALNIFTIIYIFIVEFIVMFFIVFKLKKKTIIVEEVTFRINKGFNYILTRNIISENKEEDTFIINNN